MMLIHGVEVKGKLVDSHTRCQHYHQEVDIVAIKFNCCHTYYPCYKCHNETVDHPISTWGADEFNEKAILCGSCGEELTIHEYTNNQSACPKCGAQFNSNCKSHAHLYFEI